MRMWDCEATELFDVICLTVKAANVKREDPQSKTSSYLKIFQDFPGVGIYLREGRVNQSWFDCKVVCICRPCEAYVQKK